MPEEREVFANLTVRREPARWAMQAPREGVDHLDVDEMFRYFPRSAERRNTRPATSPAASSRCSPSAVRCSANPRLILIDEPTEGLAPLLVAAVAE